MPLPRHRSPSVEVSHTEKQRTAISARSRCSGATTPVWHPRRAKPLEPQRSAYVTATTVAAPPHSLRASTPANRSLASPPATLLDGTAGHTKAQVVEAVRRRTPVTVRRPAVASGEEPAAAAIHPVRGITKGCAESQKGTFSILFGTASADSLIQWCQSHSNQPRRWHCTMTWSVGGRFGAA